MKAFVAIVALIACALAQSIPENMCSVQAFGIAGLSLDGQYPTSYNGAMYRVGDYAMYGILTDKKELVAGVLVRPDLDKTFFWMNEQGCFDRPALNLSSYKHDEDKSFNVTVSDSYGNASGIISFDDSDKLQTESIIATYMDEQMNYHYVSVTFVYSPLSLNYSYVNEDETWFSLDDSFDTCDSSSMNPAPEGKTSVQCPAPPAPPSGSTSGGSTSGGSTSGSTSGGSTSGSTSGKTGEIPADMCSVEAEGTAVLSYDGHPYSGQLVAMMMRVKNYAQYALIDSTTGNVTAAVLMRPDTGKTYLWMADEDCIERPALNLFSYEHVAGKTFSKTVTDPYGDLTGSITFDGSDKLSAETIQVAFTQGGESHTVRVAITYTPILVNYSFVNEDDDEFMAPASMSCGAASMTPAADAKTSLQCSATSSTTPTPSSSTKPTPTPSSSTKPTPSTSSSTKPTPSTSSSTKPTPSTSSSTKPTPPPPASSSAASFVVPSAMLLVAAVVAMF